MPLDARNCEARNELVALSADHGRLSVRACVCGFVRDVQRSGMADGESMSAVLSNTIVIVAIAVSLCYSVWRLGPRRMRDSVRMRLRKALPGVFDNLSASSSGGACDACGGCPSTTRAPPARKE